jgi:hypothetical protein
MQIKIDFLCRDSILAVPLGLDLALFGDLSKRAGFRGVQEWLSFYFKSPQTAEGLYPEHDVFIQSMKLKNTLRSLMGEALITSLGQGVLRLSAAPRARCSRAQMSHSRVCVAQSHGVRSKRSAKKPALRSMWAALPLRHGATMG